MNTKKRIAYVGIKGLPSQAGADRVVEAIVRNLDKEQYNPTVYCSAALVGKSVQIDGVDLLRIYSLPIKYLGPVTLFLFSALHALLFGRYDLVHLHNLEASFVLPLLRLRFPVITTSHGQTQGRTDKWGKLAITVFHGTERMCMVLSNAVTSVAKAHVRYFEDRYHKTVYYIPNGVDRSSEADEAKALAIINEAGAAPDKYILFSGRIMPTKGAHILLDAFLNLETDLKLLVVGDESILPDYSKQLRANADERVRFVPFISHKPTLLGVVKHCRIFVFPSTFEAMSMMLLEAASMHSPIVCSDIPENTDVLPTQALTFRSEDVKDLTEKLGWALNHQVEMAQFSKAAYKWVCENYLWSEIVMQYQQLYDSVLSLSPSSVTVVSSRDSCRIVTDSWIPM